MRWVFNFFIILTVFFYLPYCEGTYVNQSFTNQSGICSDDFARKCYTINGVVYCTETKVQYNATSDLSSFDVCEDDENCSLHLQAYRHYQQDMKNANIGRRTVLNITTPSLMCRSVFVNFFSYKGDTTFLNITTNVSLLSHSVFYDCERKIYNFDSQIHMNYAVNNYQGKIIFDLPSENELKNGKIFFYVHVKNNMSITFQISTADFYIINFCQHQNGKCISWKNFTTFLSLTNPSVNFSRWMNLITVYTGLLAEAGDYKAVITSSTDNSSSSTLEFHLEDTAGNYLTLSLVFGLFGIIGVLGFLGTCTIVCATLTRPRDRKCQSRILILFNPVSIAHVSEVRRFRKMLLHIFGVEVYLDFIDIPKTAHRDPNRWYNNVVHEADFIIIIIPPFIEESSERPLPYQCTFELGLSVLQSRIHSELLTKHNKLIPIVLFFPNSHEQLVPDCCLNYEKFYFPKDNNRLLLHFQKNRLRPCRFRSTKFHNEETESNKLLDNVEDFNERTTVISLKSPSGISREGISQKFPDQAISDDFGSFPPSVQEVGERST